MIVARCRHQACLLVLLAIDLARQLAYLGHQILLLRGRHPAVSRPIWSVARDGSKLNGCPRENPKRVDEGGELEVERSKSLDVEKGKVEEGEMSECVDQRRQKESNSGFW